MTTQTKLFYYIQGKELLLLDCYSIRDAAYSVFDQVLYCKIQPVKQEGNQ
jgi:hypothetical protein